MAIDFAESAATVLSDWAESDAPLDSADKLAGADQAKAAAQAALTRAGGRPSLSPTQRGSSPRRQVRLPQETSDRLDAYATSTHQSPSAVIRDALEAYLAATQQECPSPHSG